MRARKGEGGSGADLTPLTPFPTREGGTDRTPPRIGEGQGRGRILVRNIVHGQFVDRRRLERAREFRRDMTRAEEILWQELGGNRLGGLHFRRQQVIDGLIVDFYCHAAGLVVEVDGEIHRGRRAYDTERNRALSRRGLKVIHVQNAEVMRDVRAVVVWIARACERARRRT